MLRKSLNSGEKNQFLRKRRTLSERGRHFCEFCENGARFPRVEFVDFPNNSLNVYEKRAKSLNVNEKRTLDKIR